MPASSDFAAIGITFVIEGEICRLCGAQRCAASSLRTAAVGAGQSARKSVGLGHDIPMVRATPGGHRSGAGAEPLLPPVRLQAVTYRYAPSMMEVVELYDAWIEACRVERATWERVKDKLPGTNPSDAELWQEWRDASYAVNEPRP